MIKKLLVAALKIEWSHLKQNFCFIKDEKIECLYHIKGYKDCMLLQVGVGLKRAKDKFLELFTHYQCCSVFHFGTSGALSLEQKVGDLFLATEIQYQNDRIFVNHQNLAHLGTFCQNHGLGYKTGRLLSVDRALVNPEQKKAAFNDYKALAVDMESWSVASICQNKGISYLSCRGIFDLFDEDLETLGGPFDGQGNIKMSRLTANIIKEPKRILKIPELQRRQGVVNRHLSEAVMWFLG